MKKVMFLAMVALSLSATSFAQDSKMHKSDHKMSHKMSDTMYTCPMHPEVMESKPGKCAECGMALVKAKQTYTCPMHADMMRSNAGKCPKCGMDMKKTSMKKTGVKKTNKDGMKM